MKIGSVDHFADGDPRIGGIYETAEFYEVRDEGNHIVARVIREPDFPHYWLARNIKDEPIARDKFSNDLFDRLERILNDG